MSNIEQSLIADVPRLSPDEQAFMREIFDRVLIVGRSRYSPWSAEADRRDLDREGEEECFDAVIYPAMLRVKRRRERAACASADRVWHAMVGSDGFGVVTERPALPEVSSSYDCVDGAVSEVLR